MQFWALIVDSLRESLDRKIFWVMVAMTCVIALAMASIGFDGGHISFLFGVWDTTTEFYNPLTAVGRSSIIGGVIYLLMSVLLGWMGVILIIIATSSFFPTFLTGGVIDVLLSKPISRPRLFIYKYISCMVFVLLQATIFIVLTFLVMGFRWQIWAPGYLFSIPLLVLLFSYVYCISVLVAVKTRSAAAAIMISLFAWILFICPKIAVDMVESFPKLKEHKRIYETLRIVAWIPPKTGDIPYIAARWAEAGTSIDIFHPNLLASNNPEELQQIKRAKELEQKELDKSPYISIGSSLLFEAFILAWAISCFSRKDY